VVRIAARFIHRTKSMAVLAAAQICGADGIFSRDKLGKDGPGLIAFANNRRCSLARPMWYSGVRRTHSFLSASGVLMLVGPI